MDPSVLSFAHFEKHYGTFYLILSFFLGVLFYKYIWTRTEKDTLVSRRENRKALESKRRKEAYPKNFPNSWFKLMNSDDIKIGETKYVEALGKDFAVFRGEDGVVGVLEAYCPHNGANLTVGGKVVGNCIQCPFHLWEFDVDGQCTKIPYLDKAQIKYMPPVIPEFEENCRYSGRYSKTISMHLIEFAENSADFQHFQPLHGQMVLPFLGTPIPYIKIVHSANWKPEEGQDKNHLAYFYDNAHLTIFGKDIPNTSASATITFIGAGGIVMFEFITPLGKIYLFQTHLPLEPLVTKVEFLWYSERKMWTPLVWYVVGNWIAQWKNDISVWENKIFKAKPLLVKGDGPIMQLRKWLSQFYDEEEKKQSLDW